MRRRGKKDVRRRGVALVEAALVFQLLLLVTLAALQYGWAFVNLQRITNAARHGARIAAAWGAMDADGETEIAALVSDMAGATYDVATAGDLVTATVTVPKATVQLIPWNLLPLPDELRAVVTMAKELSA
jgi:Flp pilus assembly protein TadG